MANTKNKNLAIERDRMIDKHKTNTVKQRNWKWIEVPFETLLFQSRLFVLIAVVGILVASLVMFLKGSVEIIQGVLTFFSKFTGFQPNPLDDESVILAFIPAIDNYLFATILLILSMGLYELFVSKIDPPCRKDKTPPAWLSIKNWDQLKYNTGEVVIMILIVNFFKISFSISFKNPLDLLILGGGILLISGALLMTHKITRKDND
jgi:uncharacterized membrane protein YqhA